MLSIESAPGPAPVHDAVPLLADVVELKIGLRGAGRLRLEVL